ncbi:MAG: LysE family translocator, partial [Gammaproteobacteria bacterium]|nr:LysE family translocator [Gammaproteobacteria bacterium]
MVNLFALIAATMILVMIPGPNVALIVANSLRYGLRMGSITVLGTTFGVGLQLVAVVLGMAVIIELIAEALTWIRWVGVAYLIWLGIRIWNEPADDLSKIGAAPAMFWRGCLVAATNPKTLLFNAAFLPQFVGSGDSAVGQLALVASVFLTVLLAGDMLWALFAGSARRLLVRHSKIRNRFTGA